jgi:cysteinyl-tRNA synthetase
MRLYNTASGQKEELVPLKPHEISMYVCGPTTYNLIHLGNARPLVVFDTVRRYLEYRGFKVNYIQNFTDVDDKIINRANEEGEDPLQLAQRYIDEYYKDAAALGIRPAQKHPRVSEHIPEIVEAISGLISKGYAYESEGDVFFRVRAFADYGKLSGRSLDDMQAGARVNVNELKEDPMDFALWKAAKPGEPAWDSPWGKGRPGWHIECSVMSTNYLGETIDIHGGGNDLVFPHHENEIAQAEALTGRPFVNYWMHNGFITINQEKMSKSLGNFFLLRDILDKYPADVVRFYLIATHYRSPLDFDDGKLEEARKALHRLKTTCTLLEEYIDHTLPKTEDLSEKSRQFWSNLNQMRDNFIEAMDDDFNTARAIGHLFEIAHEINAYLAQADPHNTADQTVVKQAQDLYLELGDLLGIFMEKPMVYQEELIDKVLGVVARLRQTARRNKNYELADSLRDFLRDGGITVEDLEGGSRFRYESPPELNHLVDYLLSVRTSLKASRNFELADQIRDQLTQAGILVEDTREGVRWKLAES